MAPLLRLVIYLIVAHVAFPFGIDVLPCEFKNETNSKTWKLESIADCRDRGLIRVPKFSENPMKVDRLLLSNNKIAKLSNSSFVNIIPRAIDLSRNNLDFISEDAFIGLEGILTDLNLASNNLNLPLPGLMQLHSLETLSLENNPQIQHVLNRSFHGLVNLKKLDLSRNHISRFDNNAFESLENLTELQFYGNYIYAVPTVALSVLTNLETLNFDSNYISELRASAFQGLLNLKELQISRNGFEGIELIDPEAFEGLDSLETLGFYHDRLGSVPNETFTNIKALKHLDLSYTRLTRIKPGTFNALSSLENLDLSGTKVNFAKGMFTGLEDSLLTILIRNNDLVALPLDSLLELRRLQWVDAASNNFPSLLPPDFVSGLSIKRLGIMWMGISTISNQSFRGLEKPLMLELDQDNISTLDFITDPCQYDYIALLDNPVVCDCHVYNITMAEVIHFEGTCYSPPTYEGLRIGGPEFKRLAAKDCGNLPITGRLFCPRIRDYLDY